jgi:hypothetical protein
MGISPFRKYREDEDDWDRPLFGRSWIDNNESIHGANECSSKSHPKQSRPDGNPNPTNFRIEKVVSIEEFLITLVVYPDCFNYRGKKILVFEGVSKKALQDRKVLDPHFSSKKSLSPIARFEPTARGWKWAISFCQNQK